MEAISEMISQEVDHTGRAFSAAPDPRLLAPNPSYPLPDVFYPTTEQVYFDQLTSFGFPPDVNGCDDVVPSLLEPDATSVPVPLDPQTQSQCSEEHNQRRRSASSVLPEKRGKRRGAQAKVFTCTHCKKKFSKNFDFCQHLRSHTGEKPFLCIFCGLAFAQKCNVKKHLATHMVWNPHRLSEETFTTTGHLPRETLRGNSMDKGFECRFCTTTSFTTYAEFRAHLKTHIAEKVFRCILPSCEQMPGNAEELLNHVKDHEIFKEYKCSSCDAVLPNLYQLSFHNYAHGENDVLSSQRSCGRRPERFQYRCEICHERFSEPEDLKTHRESEGHLFSCPHCSSRFSEERYLRRHLVVHDAETGFLCEHCGRGFKLKHHLASHILTHNEKAFSCPKCSRAFARPDQVVRHVKAVHEPRSFQCESCLKTFSRKDKLREHLKYKRTRCLPLQDTV